MDGLVLIDKPGGLTSHDVVNRWRKLAGTKRVGHLGTLDPMATGLLALVSGRATRLAQFFGKDDKTYLAEITFGLVSDTYDAEGRIECTGAEPPSEPAIADGLRFFTGRFSQTPPPVSAKKISGIPAYKLARKQLPVELKPVEVEVKHLEICRIWRDDAAEAPRTKVSALLACSSGTYIRSIAHDLGERLRCGALLSGLQRVQIGEYRLEQARTLTQLTEMAAQGRLREAMIAPADLLISLPAEHFDTVVEARIRSGQSFRTSPFVVPPGAPLVKALSHSGDLIAIGELKIPNLYHPGTVL